MTEESNLEALQRKVKTVQRRSALCYLATQMLGDDKIVKDPIERPLTLLVGNFPINNRFRWKTEWSGGRDSIDKILDGEIIIEHRRAVTALTNAPPADHETSDIGATYSPPLHFAIHRGAILPPEDLLAQEELLDRALIAIQQELDSIRKDLHAGETFPKIGPYR